MRDRDPTEAVSTAGFRCTAGFCTACPGTRRCLRFWLVVTPKPVDAVRWNTKIKAVSRSSEKIVDLFIPRDGAPLWWEPEVLCQSACRSIGATEPSIVYIQPVAVKLNSDLF